MEKKTKLTFEEVYPYGEDDVLAIVYRKEEKGKLSAWNVKVRDVFNYVYKGQIFIINNVYCLKKIWLKDIFNYIAKQELIIEKVIYSPLVNETNPHWFTELSIARISDK